MRTSSHRRTSYLTLVSLRIELHDETTFSGDPSRILQHEAAPLVSTNIRQAINSALELKQHAQPFPEVGVAISAGLKRFEAYLLDVRATSGHWYVIRFRAGRDRHHVNRVMGAGEPGRVYRYVHPTDLYELARDVEKCLRLPAVEQ